jgi:hypothetical protein
MALIVCEVAFPITSLTLPFPSFSYCSSSSHEHIELPIEYAVTLESAHAAVSLTGDVQHRRTLLPSR